VQAPDPPPPQLAYPLVEGVDYYVEGGRWVFTAAYHLRRGSCCGSGCRHCPYGRSPQGGDDGPEPAVGVEPADRE
jgi:hypothetical protein